MKNLLLSILIFFSANPVISQFYGGISASYTRIGFVANTIGFSGNAGYSILNSHVDLGVNYENAKAFDRDNFSVSTFNLDLKYKPFNFEYFNPFIGVFYGQQTQITYLNFIDQTFKDKFTMAGGSVGIFFKNDLIKNLYIILEYNHRLIGFNSNLNLFAQNNLSIGFKYYLNLSIKE